MKLHIPHSRQRGAALIIGMILLAVITILAVVGMNVSNSELAAATSEQTRQRAFEAAEAGIEYGMDEIFDVDTVDVGDIVGPVTAVTGAPVNASSGAAADHYQTTKRYRGRSTLTIGFNQKFTAYHYSIVSDGTAGRNAKAQHVQGAYILGNASNGDETPL